ncbi:unnamed protein product, partial [Prorocentrum cordatum]
ALGDNPVLTFKAGSGNNTGDIFKRRACHNAESRIFQLLSNDDELRNQWKNMNGANDRAAFWARAQSLYGKELKIFVEETLEEAFSHTTKDDAHADADWLDEDEVRNHPKLQGKADQISNILKNGKTWFDTGRGTKLYEVFFYQTKKSDTEEQNRTMKRKVALNAVKSDEMEDFVSKRQLTAAGNSLSELIRVGDMINAVTARGKCEKGFVTTACKEGNSKASSAKSATATLNDLLKTAAEELEAEAEAVGADL